MKRLRFLLALTTLTACGASVGEAPTDADPGPPPDAAAAADPPRDGPGGRGGADAASDSGAGGAADVAAPDAPSPDAPLPDAAAEARAPDVQADTGPRAPQQFYVSPAGDDASDGLSAARPWKTILKAMFAAEAGDTVNLGDGVYPSGLFTIRAGTAAAPITIRGQAGAVLRSATRRAVEIAHDYVTIEGFTVDGLHGDPAMVTGYSDVLIHVAGLAAKPAVTGARILRMTVRNALSECIRIRSGATRNEVGFSTVGRCGIGDYVLMGGASNGEGIYIGTGLSTLMPTVRDPSDENWIHDNLIDTQGNECVEVREFSSRNLVEKNKCTGQKTTNSAGFIIRGSGNVLRGNEIHGNAGAGIRIGTADVTIPASEGIGNDIYENFLHDNVVVGLMVYRSPQGRVCGNRFSTNPGGDVRGMITIAQATAACPALPDAGAADALPLDASAVDGLPPDAGAADAADPDAAADAAPPDAGDPDARD